MKLQQNYERYILLRKILTDKKYSCIPGINLTISVQVKLYNMTFKIIRYLTILCFDTTIVVQDIV